MSAEQAAEIAKSRGIPVYTIGAGRDGIVPFPVFDDQGNKVGMRRMISDLDEGALRDIANTTGGHYFRAADKDTIESAFNAIDKAKKIDFHAKSYLITTELFPWPAAPGLLALVLGALDLLPEQLAGHDPASAGLVGSTPSSAARSTDLTMLV